MSKETPADQAPLAAAQLTFSADDARVLEALVEMMQRADVQTVRAAARLAAAILADARSRGAARA